MTPTLAEPRAIADARPDVPRESLLSSETPLSQETLLPQFLCTVEETVAGRHRLLTLLERESRLVLGGDLDALTRCLQEKEDALGGLALLERRRQEEFERLRRRLGSTSPELGPERGPERRLSQLIAAIPEPYRTALASCQARLDEVTTRIVHLNQITGRVVARLLEQRRTLLEALRRLAHPPTAYAATGRLTESPIGGRTLGQG